MSRVGLMPLDDGAVVVLEAQREHPPYCFTCFGRPWRIRTADQRIKSPLLYQLS
jgi:hypothetical protein